MARLTRAARSRPKRVFWRKRGLLILVPFYELHLHLRRRRVASAVQLNRWEYRMNALSTPRRAGIAALCTGAAATLVLFVSVPDEFPAVPPGAIILMVTAGIVAFAPGRWAPLVGLLVPLLILVGGVATGATPDLLFSPDNAGALLGIVVQTLALPTAIVSGVFALRAEARRWAQLKPTT